MEYDAIILAGGRGARLGGIDKAGLLLAGSPLIARPLAAAHGALRTVLVGPDSVRPDSGRPDSAPGGSEGGGSGRSFLLTREDPPLGGPAAATIAGLAALTAEARIAPWVLLLSCDLPLASAGVPRLLTAASRTAPVDGYCLTDAQGRLQWLFALYRTAALLDVARACSQPTGTSMRALLATLRLVGVPDTADVSADLDTWADHAAWTERLEAPDGRFE